MSRESRRLEHEAHKPTCPYCGAVGTITHHKKKLKGDRRKSKFGGGWVVGTVLTGGLAIPLFGAKRGAEKKRRKPVVSINQWNECSACHMKW